MIDKEIKDERKANFLKLCSDLSEGYTFCYEDTYCKVTYEAINGNLVETTFYKKNSPLNDGKEGETDIKKGRDAAIDLLEGAVYAYSSKYSRLIDNQVTLSESAKKSLTEYLINLNNKIEELAKKELAIYNNLDYAIGRACSNLREDSTTQELADFENAIPVDKISNPLPMEEEKAKDNAEVINGESAGEKKEEIIEGQKEEITIIAERQEEGKFRKFVNFIKGIISKIHTKDGEDKDIE